jgi:endoglucanase
MQDQSFEFLKRLMNTIGPSGYEQESARVWMTEAKTFTDEVWGDQHGNAYAVVNKGGGPRVMLAGHLDEIGLLITHIDDNGFLYFTGIGGWDPQVLAGQRIWISTKNGRINGAIGKKPIHLMEDKDRSNAVKLDGLWIDIGAKDKEEALKMVSIGDPAVIAYGFEELPNGLAMARGFDDRVGAFVVLEAARMLSAMNPSAEVYAVGTVQEEIGLRGATTSAYRIDPKAGIAVDVDFATDFPTMDGEKKKSGDVKMGGGPSVTRGANINPKMHDLMIAAADENGIPYQVKAYARGTGTDANAMQLSRSGIATGLIGVPNRYMHTPCEIVHLEDLENCWKMIAHTVATIDESTDFTFTDI